MTTPERSIEEIVEEFNSTFPGCDQCQYGNGQGDWIEHWLTQTLQAERQRCEEMVEAERERLAGLIKPRAQKFINKVDKGLARSKETYKDMHYIVDLLNEVTQPNNPK